MFSTEFNPKEDQRSDEALFEAILHSDDEVSYSACTALHYRPTQAVFDKSKSLCQSKEAREREAGVNVLAQLGVEERPFLDKTVEILLKMLETEEDSETLSSIGVAFSHNRVEKSLEPLSKLKTHPSSNVRYGVVCGIMSHTTELAIATLIELSNDSDDDVRDWATFALGSMNDVDNPGVREALFNRLDDKHHDVRGEALCGLAVRKDERVVEYIKKELNSSEVHILALEAAGELGDSTFYELLLRLKKSLEEDPHYSTVLDDAIEACKPN